MKYIVRVFSRGDMVREVYYEAKTYRSAAVKAVASLWVSWSNLVVVNENFKARRYSKNVKTIVKIIRDVPEFYPVWHSMKPCMLVNVGKYSEIYYFKTEQERDECMTSAHAESAANDKAQTDITASSAETYDSSNGLTWRKILSGYVTSVTWMEKLIRFNIDESSGSNNADDSDKDEWSIGSTPFHSRLRRTFATVTNLNTEHGYSSFNMQKYLGTTIEVKKHRSLDRIWLSRRWAWAKEWLDFRNVYLQVKVDKYQGISGIKRFQPCGDHFTYHGTCVPKGYLKVPTFAKGKIVGGHPAVGLDEKDIQHLIGTDAVFAKSDTGNWLIISGEKVTKNDHYYISEEWIEFAQSKPKTRLDVEALYG